MTKYKKLYIHIMKRNLLVHDSTGWEVLQDGIEWPVFGEGLLIASSLIGRTKRGQRKQEIERSCPFSRTSISHDNGINTFMRTGCSWANIFFFFFLLDSY
jgi:hypothetical protein